MSSCCNDCVNCEGITCNSSQAFCSIGKQSASALIGNANAPSIARNDIIIEKLPQTKLNDLINYINKAMDKGNTKNSNSEAGGNIAKETRNFIYADKIQAIIDAMKGMNSDNNPNFTPRKDDIIYASNFNTLMNKINNLKVHTSACDLCNTGCQAECNSGCQGCTSCNACNNGCESGQS